MLTPVPAIYSVHRVMAMHLRSQAQPSHRHLSLQKLSVMSAIRMGTHLKGIHFISYSLLYNKLLQNA